MQSQSSRSGVIVADDSALMRDVLRSCLDRNFGNIYLAANGLEAMELARRIRAALVLLDYKMPHMNGVEVCREIRRLHGYEKAPVVLITAFNDERSHREALRAGATLVIGKPLSRDHLLETLAPLLPPPPEARPSADGLRQARDFLNERRRVEADTEARRFGAGMAERAWPVRSLWGR